MTCATTSSDESVDDNKDGSRRITADGHPNDATDRDGDEVTIESVGLQFMLALEESGIPKEELVQMTLSQILAKFSEFDGDLDQASSANIGAGDDAASKTDQGWLDYEAVRGDGDRPLFSRGNFGKYGARSWVYSRPRS